MPMGSVGICGNAGASAPDTVVEMISESRGRRRDGRMVLENQDASQDTSLWTMDFGAGLLGTEIKRSVILCALMAEKLSARVYWAPFFEEDFPW